MSRRQLIDTNLVIRYLVGDDARHAAAAAKHFQASDRGELTLVLLPAVFCECVFVLESFYKHPRHKIAETLKILITSSGVELADQSVHLDALARYSGSKIHFVDCLLAAYAAAERLPVITFDKDFGKFADVQVVHPTA